LQAYSLPVVGLKRL